ncbi:MAG: DUF1592 domain-containing protein [Rhodospirillaceae bacterium]
MSLPKRSARRRAVYTLAAGSTALMLAACGAGTGEGVSRNVAAAPGPSPEASVAGTPKRLRLISSDQYLNILAYAFGEDIRIETNFPPLGRAEGLLQIGASSAGVASVQMEQYQRAASTISARIVDPAHRDFTVRCKPANPDGADPACAAKFLTAAGRILFRRPLTAAERDEAVQDAGAAAVKLKSFYTGLGVAVEGLLMSPRFLYFEDTVEPDPKARGGRRFDAYTVASRLSFFLWNTAPDDELLRAAETGEILTPKGLDKAIDRMLASPRLETGVRAFFDDMFHFDEFNTLAKDPDTYPDFTGVTAADAREQTLRTVVDHLIVRKRDYRDLFTTRDTFVSPSLAPIYNVSVSAWSPYQFPPDSPRAGLLTQASFLALRSHPGRSSPTLRGKALREIFLCQNVPPPPGNVDFSALENPDPNIRTQRERVTFHLHNPVCAGCHKITDPAGLALENFDGAGQYRTEEKGSPIDTSGALDGQPFKDVVGLGNALRNHPALTSCLVKRAYSYATGGAAGPNDAAELASLHARFAAGGFKFPVLLKAIVSDPAFLRVRPDVQPTAVAAASHSDVQTEK